ncbi:MAG: hypothetical protein ACJAS3_003180 [Roseivirga sp.]
MVALGSSPVLLKILTKKPMWSHIDGLLIWHSEENKETITTMAFNREKNFPMPHIKIRNFKYWCRGIP